MYYNILSALDINFVDSNGTLCILMEQSGCWMDVELFCFLIKIGLETNRVVGNKLFFTFVASLKVKN